MHLDGPRYVRDRGRCPISCPHTHGKGERAYTGLERLGGAKPDNYVYRGGLAVLKAGSRPKGGYDRHPGRKTATKTATPRRSHIWLYIYVRR